MPPLPTRECFVNARGERFSLLRAAPISAAPALLWIHATGFNAATYHEMLAELGRHLDVRAPDLRGHGLSAAPAEAPRLRSWDVYRDDLIAFLDDLDRPVCLAGHSIGGAISLAAAARRPGSVSGLLLVEPVLLDQAAGRALAQAQRAGKGRQIPQSLAARKRRAVFPSRQAAVDNFIGRGAFASWRRSWIEAYVEGGTREREDGRVELTCAPAWESTTFAVTTADPWPDVARLACPVTLIVGRHGSTCGNDSVRRFLELQPSTRLAEVEQASHFLPMEQPERVIREILARAAPAR